MSTTPAQAIRILEAYNQKAEWLFGSDFNLKVLSNPEVGRMRAEKGRIEYTTINDFKEQFYAFCLPYRILIQPKDSISLQEVYKLYKLPFVPPVLLANFTKIRDAIDAQMQGRLIGTWDGAPDNYQQLHDTVFYAELAHRNDDKVDLFEKWDSHPATSYAIWAQVAIVINWKMTLIQYVERLNEELIRHLNTDTTP